MTVVQLVDCQAMELVMEKEAVATPVYFQQMDLEAQAALKNLFWCLARDTHSLPAKRWFVHTVRKTRNFALNIFALNIFALNIFDMHADCDLSHPYLVVLAMLWSSPLLTSCFAQLV